MPRRFLILIPADLIRGSIDGGSETVSGMAPRVKPEGIRFFGMDHTKPVMRGLDPRI
jgi:hypothetical protein